MRVHITEAIRSRAPIVGHEDAHYTGCRFLGQAWVVVWAGFESWTIDRDGMVDVVEVVTVGDLHALELASGPQGTDARCSCGEWETSGSPVNVQLEHKDHLSRVPLFRRSGNEVPSDG